MTNSLVTKIWSFCDTLRDDGVEYGDYLEQITYLLFLKIANEFSEPPYNRDFNIPKDCEWSFFLNHEIEGLEKDYIDALKKLSLSGGMLTNIFSGAQNKIHDPYKLQKLIRLINEESWASDSTDIKGDIYESLLQKSAESSGAGQYFTPRPIIKAMSECVKPKPKETISDPTCGTGGFFLGALEYLQKNHSIEIEIDSKKRDFLKNKTFDGNEIVPSTVRLCLMNLFLHGVGDLQETPEIKLEDSLIKPKKKKVDIVLANPPFGNSSSYTITNDVKLEKQDGYKLRRDFWTTTSNKQLCFVQHIISMLKKNGRAAIVLPDNVLFEGGAGEIIRKELLEKTNLHTILRLPTGIFYANGVKVNVLFLENGKKTEEIWFYDYRTNIHHTLKKYPLQFRHLKSFVECHNSKDRRKTQETWSSKNINGRFRKYELKDILKRDKTNLNITWLKDNSYVDLDSLPDPEILAQDIIDNLESALASFREVVKKLEKN